MALESTPLKDSDCSMGYCSREHTCKSQGRTGEGKEHDQGQVVKGKLWLGEGHNCITNLHTTTSHPANHI